MHVFQCILVDRVMMTRRKRPANMLGASSLFYAILLLMGAQSSTTARYIKGRHEALIGRKK
jgi:hypothetical protein